MPVKKAKFPADIQYPASYGEKSEVSRMKNPDPESGS